MPALSIVTIVRNHKDGLIRTIGSVKSQIFSDYEYIVVDGASTDGTLDVIKDNLSIITKVLYGPDGGIYDAMNKGAASATGDYILFMNAGDVFANDYALEKIFAEDMTADVVYGDYLVEYSFGRKLIKAKPVNDFWKGMITSHQAFIVKTKMMQEHPFDCSVPIGADFDRLYSFFVKGAVFEYFPVTISVMEPGGLSDVRRMTVFSNHLDTIVKYGARFYQRAYYIYIFADTWLRLFVKKIIPKKLMNLIIRIKAGK